jgi:hypothetical protein
LLIIALATALWLPFAGFDHQEARYFVPSLALLSIIAADVFVRGVRGMLDDTMRLLPAALVVLLVAHALFQLGPLRETLDPDDVRETGTAGQYIAGLMTPDERFVAFNPTLAVSSGRTLAPSLEMGQFSFWPQMSDDRARAVGVVNVSLLERVMLDPSTQVIALDDYDLSLIARFREEDQLVPERLAWPYKLFPSLIGRFQLVRRFDNFGQFAGTLYVLERATPVACTPSPPAQCPAVVPGG